jgi:hypothetical protein
VWRRVVIGLSAFSRHRLTTPLSSEVRDALRGHDRASLEMDLEDVIMRVCRYVVGGSESANLEVVSERVWRFT